MADISLRIKNLRLLRKLSQSEFARSVGISRNNLSLIEFGAQKPTIETVIAISGRYNISSDYLLTGLPDPGLGNVLNLRLDYLDTSGESHKDYFVSGFHVELHYGNAFANSSGHFITVIVNDCNSSPVLERYFEQIATKVRFLYILDLVARVNDADIRWIQRIPVFKDEPLSSEVSMIWVKALKRYSLLNRTDMKSNTVNAT